YYVPALGGFGVYFKQPPQAPEGTPGFGPAKPRNDPKMIMKTNQFHMPFQPYGMEVLTPFTHNHDSPALRADPKDPKSSHTACPTREHRTNWDGQGADAGLYSNSDIHAIRILAMEPASIPVAGRFQNHAGERLRILGEIPVRKFGEPGASATGGQPRDPDGNP